MNRKLILAKFFIIAVLAVGCFVILQKSGDLKRCQDEQVMRTQEPPDSLLVASLMEIIKKSPDYPSFLKIIKSDSFDGSLKSYYNISLEQYQQKKAEWEKAGGQNKEFKNILNAIKITENSFFVELRSRSNPHNGLTAIVNLKTKEPQLLMVDITVDAGISM